MDYNGIDVLLRAVQSIEFASLFSVISGYKIFCIAMQDSEILAKLIGAAMHDSERIKVIVDTLHTLLDKDIDHRYQHPDDIAIACLLYVLDRVDMLSALLMAAKVVATPNLFWAYKVADEHLQA